MKEMNLNRSQLTDAVRTTLQRTDKLLKPNEISFVIGQDIGAYADILGPLEADGEIEYVGERVQWKPELFDLVPGEPIDQDHRIDNK